MKNNKNVIKVLQVVSCMNRGGIETFLMNIYRNIDRNKIQFDFLYCSNIHVRDGKCDYDDEILELGGSIFKVDDYKTVGLKRFKKQVGNIMKNGQYSVVHSHNFLFNGIILKVAKDVGVVQRISHSHTSIDCNETTLKRIMYRMYMKALIRRNSTCLLGCSEKANEYLYGKQYSKMNAQITNNAIDTKQFSFNQKRRDQVRSKLNLKDKFVIGHIGRFSPEKNHTYIIDIFKIIVKKDPTAVLVLVGGDNGIENEIKEKVSREGISENVFFMGVRTDISDLLQAMDVFVFPSIYEGLPVTLIEAQASGVKCIVSDNITKESKVTEMIDFISINEQPEYWAKHILKIGNAYKRENLYNIILKSRFDIKGVSNELEELYSIRNI